MNLKYYIEKACEIDMPKNAMKVFLYMVLNSSEENKLIHISQESIRRNFGWTQPGTVKAIKQLAETGLIEIEKKGRYNYYNIL